MKKVIIIIWILGVVTLAGLIAYSESFSQPTEEPETGKSELYWCDEDGNDFRIDPNSELVESLNLLYDPNFYSTTKAVCIELYYPNAKSVDEVASSLREYVGLGSNKKEPKEVIDIEVTIGDETHTASFEDFFEWMGFNDKDDCTKDGLTYCITKFGDGTIEKIELISPKDPNCLMTVDDFMFKLLVERHIEPERR